MDELNSCRLCPRECGVDRHMTVGYCNSPAHIVAARASLHMWEEPCISGEKGSGTVFFSGCPLRCVYCQNKVISDCKTGKGVTLERLSEIFLELQEKGAENINLVTPTHYTLSIIKAVKSAREKGLSIPVLYNCSGYEKVETLKKLEGIIDIYLVDFKYMDEDVSMRYSNAKDYSYVAKKAIDFMVKQVGRPVFSEEGIMKKGVIVRHLILPDCTDDSKEIIRYLYNKYRDDIFISIMNQYTPVVKVDKYPELSRTITQKEYDEVIDYAISLGVENAFVQEGETAKESFIPLFDCTGI